jgi:hypothetical protein
MGCKVEVWSEREQKKVWRELTDEKARQLQDYSRATGHVLRSEEEYEQFVAIENNDQLMSFMQAHVSDSTLKNPPLPLERYLERFKRKTAAATKAFTPLPRPIRPQLRVFSS